MSEQQPQFVRCANNPEHIYPAYLPECDICAMMSARPQTQAPVYPVAPASPISSHYTPSSPVYSNDLMEDDGPSDQEILRKYGVHLVWAAIVIGLLVFIVNWPHQGPATG